MSFQLEADESVARGARRVLASQLKKALGRLGGERPADDTVHGVRKRLKKVRALIKLVRTGLGSSRARRANYRLRDAGRPLTEVRDAQALLESLDALTQRFNSELSDQRVLQPVREALEKRAAAIRDRVLAADGPLAEVVEGIEKARRRLKSRAVRKGGWGVVKAGLRRTYRQARDAHDRVVAEHSVENLHEWRKRTKDLRYQLEFLHNACPAMMGEGARRCHDLTDALGDDHDLVVLAQVLQGDLQLAAEAAPLHEQLRSFIETRRGELQNRALELGRDVYASSPADFVREVHWHWKAWRAGQQQPALCRQNGPSAPVEERAVIGVGETAPVEERAVIGVSETAPVEERAVIGVGEKA
jgi:CHAD domain-containing protein